MSSCYDLRLIYKGDFKLKLLFFKPKLLFLQLKASVLECI